MPEVSDHTSEIDGLPVFWRSAPAPAGRRENAVPVYLHGAPTNSDDWLPFLSRTGGLAPDLPGFGRSGKPGSRRYTIDEYDLFIERFLEMANVERVQLVMHDWGGVGLALAQAMPERVERLVAIAVVPFLPGYRWHRAARIWRTPLAGELFMGYSFKWAMRRASREWLAAEGPAPEAMIDDVWRHWDHGTQRAILKLYRSAPPPVLAAAGEQLGDVRAPALIAWGDDDPYLPPSFAHALAEKLGGPAEVELLEGARHWPWLDRPELVDRVVAFVGEKP